MPDTEAPPARPAAAVPDVSGVLAAAVKALGGQERSGQIEMAEQVSQALGDGKHLLVQAGTGTGKSLAYLVPSLLHHDRVVVATATLALQHQLVERDIPRLVEAIGDQVDASYAVLKGRGNYACLHRIREGVPDEQGALVDVPDRLDGREGARAARVGREGVRGRRHAASATTRRATPTASGGRSASTTASAWARRKCPFAAECFAERAREKAQRSHLIVTNHSLLAIDAIEGVPMIPDYDAVVIDEAHELTARVTQAATDELAVNDIERASRRSQRWVEDESADDAGRGRRRAGRGDRGHLARPDRAPAPTSSPRRSPWCATPPASCLSAYPQGHAVGRRRRRPHPGQGHGAGGLRQRRADGGQPRERRAVAQRGARPHPRAAAASRRCRCGGRCATSCSPTRPSSSPARP